MCLRFKARRSSWKRSTIYGTIICERNENRFNSIYVYLLFRQFNLTISGDWKLIKHNCYTLTRFNIRLAITKHTKLCFVNVQYLLPKIYQSTGWFINIKTVHPAGRILIAASLPRWPHSREINGLNIALMICVNRFWFMGAIWKKKETKKKNRKRVPAGNVRPTGE